MNMDGICKCCGTPLGLMGECACAFDTCPNCINRGPVYVFGPNDTLMLKNAPQLDEPITEFKGEYAFLSNFWQMSTPVQIGDIIYMTTEHLFQAMKTKDMAERQMIANAYSPGQAKRLGRKITLRPDWEDVKIKAMKYALDMKFRPGTPEAEMLVATGNAALIEGNYWNDTFWGICRGQGYNHLGLLLMQVRNELNERKQMFHGMRILDDCPNWPLVGALNRSGNWTGAEIEFFAEKEDGVPTHVHFYLTPVETEEIWRQVSDRIPTTCTTCSF